MKPPLSILLVDDNVDLLENLTEILRDAGAEVAPTSNVADALELLAAQSFDLAITDMRMPGMGGVDLLQQIHERWPSLPAVVMTAYSRDSTLQRAWEQGILTVLPKPVDVRTLLGLVERIREIPSPILLVEDDVDLSANLSQALLEVAGVLPIRAASIAEARRAIGSAVPRLAVIDLKLPDGDGAELGVELQARFEGLQIVHITAFGSSSLIDALRTRENVEVLEKPFLVKRLVSVVE
ncbi:MAG TPA: response regulator, partial [Kofleriaceae bacterium]|nr:response regulator [Kofleriaceae bacterium]